MAAISLGMIVRNESRTLGACLASVAPFVDEIVIGLAGPSEDNTEEIARQFTDKVFPIEWVDDFADARNQVLDRCTGDYFLWLDGDDILVGAEKMREYIEKFPNMDMFYFGYDYGRDDQGQNICYLIRERLVKRRAERPDYKWVGAIHEVLIPQFTPEGLKVNDIVVVHHKPPMKHEAGRNLKILIEEMVRSEPNPDPRTVGYIATELAGAGQLAAAIPYWARFITLSGWDEERYQAHLKMSMAYGALGQFDKALRVAQDAVAILPTWPDAYFSIAKAYVMQGKHPAALEYLQIGASKPKPETMLIINPLEYSYEPLMLTAFCYAQLGDMQAALANYSEAYKLRPDEKLANQIQLIRQQLELANVAQAFHTLREHLGRNDEWLKVRRLFDVVPKHLDQQPSILAAWQRTMQQTAHIDNPQIMTDFYTSNPHWGAMNEEQITDPGWLRYPRMKFALDTARRIGAKNVVDWGCSDGFIALPLARELGIHVTGFDLDPRCVDLAGVRAGQWGVDARFEVGNVDEIGGWEGEKADLALFFEVIEHVVDPNTTLERLEKTAKHIAITTPYMSWEGGNIPAWDRVEPKGHLRIFDQYDLERILSQRGRIWNLYREPWINRGWLFADYEPGVKTDKTIIVGAMGSVESWNPRSLENGGLGGSETAVIKLCEGLARAGHRPIVYNRNDEPGYYNGVCYRIPDHFRPQVRSDLFIAWRWAEAADLDINTEKLVLWMHDTDLQDRLTKARADKFDAIVVLTNWHKEYMKSIYPFLTDEKFVVIGNGVDPDRFLGENHRNPKKVVYSSSPDRGLDVILESIWPKIVQAEPDAELHLYYGWNSFDKFIPIYPQLAEQKAKLMDMINQSRNIIQHGRVSQETLAAEMKSATVWLYPTHFSETYCITAVEAQLAGAIPVTNHLAALSETVRSGAILEGDVRNPEVQSKYAEMVINILRMNPEERKGLHKIVRENAPAFSWAMIADQWIQHFLQREN